MQQTPQDHPLNEQATQILQAMQLEPEMSLPILDLLVWAHGGILTDEIERLMLMANRHPHKTMNLIAGRNQENGLPELTSQELEHLQSGTQRQQEQIHVSLRMNLKNLLEDVNL